MTEFLNTVLTFPTLVYSVLLAFCMVYWLLAATGIVDFDAVDGWLTTDGDTAEPNVVAGMVARLGLSGVPMMLVLTVLSFFGWLITYFVHLFLLQHLPDGLRWIGSLFHGAAEHLERRAFDAPLPDPRALREDDQYVNELRTRVHIHF